MYIFSTIAAVPSIPSPINNGRSKLETPIFHHHSWYEMLPKSSLVPVEFNSDQMLTLTPYLLCSLITFLLFLLRLLLRTSLIHALHRWRHWLDDRLYVHHHLNVPQFNDSTHQENPFYRRVALYLDSLPSLHDSDFINLLSGRSRNDIILTPDDDHVIHDSFLGARLSWLNRIDRDQGNNVVSRSFLLRIKKRDKRRILRPYLQHIHTVADDVEERGRELRIHNNCNGGWKSSTFHHPANFDSLVICQDLKSRIQSELETFARSKQYHHKLGRVWKRSYLLYGPSGTGKSSFIAAVANFLNYDVYNVNLWQVIDDADLNSLLVESSSKSVIVVEDLDRYILENPNPRISTSALLNFMDGISNFQDERIMIFTMNSKENVDSFILRPGRIDVHIYFPLCDFNAFKNLASNYLGIKEHKLFPQVEEIFQSGRSMSQAEISELMLVNRNSPSRALKAVISALETSSRHGRKMVPLMSDSASSSPVAEDYDGAAWKESLPKEFRKLYGILRMKSGRKSASFDHDQESVIIDKPQTMS